MKIRHGLIIILLIFGLSGTGYLMNKLLHLRNFFSHEEYQECSVIVWNKSPLAIDLILRPARLHAQSAEVGSGSRACMIVRSKDKTQQQPELLKYVAVRYMGRKYKFYEKEMLNHCFDASRSTRYFALMCIDSNDMNWASMKERLAKDNIKLHEGNSYLVLSNYPKLSAAWDNKAKFQVLRIRTPRVPANP